MHRRHGDHRADQNKATNRGCMKNSTALSVCLAMIAHRSLAAPYPDDAAGCTGRAARRDRDYARPIAQCAAATRCNRDAGSGRRRLAGLADRRAAADQAATGSLVPHVQRLCDQGLGGRSCTPGSPSRGTGGSARCGDSPAAPRTIDARGECRRGGVSTKPRWRDIGRAPLCNTLEPEALQLTHTAFLDNSKPQAQQVRDGNGQR